MSLINFHPSNFYLPGDNCSTIVLIAPAELHGTSLLWVHPSPRTGAPVMLRCICTYVTMTSAWSVLIVVRVGMQISQPGSTHDPCRCPLTPNPRKTTTNPLFLIALGRAPPAASSCVCVDGWGWRTGRHVWTGWSSCFVGWLVLRASQVVVPKPPIHFI